MQKSQYLPWKPSTRKADIEDIYLCWPYPIQPNTRALEAFYNGVSQAIKYVSSYAILWENTTGYPIP